jgi:flagellar protein FlgJ
MDINQLLAAILSPGGTQSANRLASAGQPSAVGDHNNPALLQQAMAQFQQPQTPAQAPQQPQMPSQAPQGQPMPQSAPQAAPMGAPAPSGGGIGGFLSNLFQGPEARGKNQTIDWLQKQGMDQGTAMLMAGNKPALQQYLLKRSQGGEGFTLGEGQTRYDAAGNVVASGGEKDDRPWWVRGDGTVDPAQIANRQAGRTSVTTNVGEGDKFYGELDKAQAAVFSGLSETGIQGRSKLGQIDRLDGLLKQAETGGLALIKQAAGEWGINTEGLSDIQAAQALINELVPQQRQPGSGPMSDADLALFKQSLPRLINQPGGNQTIVDTMRGITQYQIQMGEIADAVADRSMTPADARKALRELQNPLEGFGKRSGGDVSTMPAPEGVAPELWKHMPLEDRKLWQ